MQLVHQFVETWRINNRINLKLLDGISEEALHFIPSGQKQLTPAKQFAHIHNIRIWRLEKLDEDLSFNIGKIDPSDKIIAELLRLRLLRSAAVIADILEEGYEKNGVIKGYKRGIFPFMGYLIAHEAHHRGKMIQILKQNGYSLPRSLTYGIWDWNKV